MLSLLHISDLHFGPYYLPDVGEAVLRAAATLEPDIIVASGDFTQRAKPAEYEAAHSFFARLPPVPLVVTPGNHDVPLYRVFERLLTPYALYRQHIASELDTVLRHPSAIVAAINSTSPLRAITNGRISSWQLDFCSDAFKATADQRVRIVVAHHHFAPAPDYERSQTLPRAKRALDRLVDLRVDLILGGHLHRAYIGNSLDVYSGKDRQHGIIIVQSGTTTSRRGRAREQEKNSFNLLRISDEIIRITHYMYFDDAGGFEPVGHHIFPRAHRKYFAREDEEERGATGQGSRSRE